MAIGRYGGNLKFYRVSVLAVLTGPRGRTALAVVRMCGNYLSPRKHSLVIEVIVVVSLAIVANCGFVWKKAIFLPN